ncbi:hypothetical protein [Atlantibacter sp.]|uniref:hypothetical protein n=1 Tax=Atlantibacter sp. TaxID=1903473 RepID=UPI0028A77EBB|nr:hypothetical protein [Atlantibacter sp.]
MTIRKIFIYLLALFSLASVTAGAVYGWQYWQRSHFNCVGETLIERPPMKANMVVKYIFNGDNGVAVLRGEIQPENAEPIAVNHNVFFTFTRKGNDYFLISKEVFSSTGGITDTPLLLATLPQFYLRPNVTFYLNINKVSQDGWMFYTSRTPSLYCRG